MLENKKDIARMVKPHIKAPRNGKAFNNCIMKLNDIHNSLKTKKGKKHLEESILKYYNKYGTRHKNREPLNLNDLEGGCLCNYVKFAKLEGGFLNVNKVVSGVNSARRLYTAIKKFTRDNPWSLELADKVYSYAIDSMPNLEVNVDRVKRLYNIMKDFTEANQWTITLASMVLAYVSGEKTKEDVLDNIKPDTDELKEEYDPLIMEETDTKDLSGDTNDFNLDDGEINDLMRKLLSSEVSGNTTIPTFKGRRKLKVGKRF
tara:strand:- start:644 stop:1423 length:780 start_codon:yes stop_codon:yes gene_type:complete